MEGESQEGSETAIALIISEPQVTEKPKTNLKGDSRAWMGTKAVRVREEKMSHLPDCNINESTISSSIFYGTSGRRQSIPPALVPGKARRKALLAIACDKKRHWREFHSQSEAFAYCDKWPEAGLRTWASEIDSKGRRRFISATLEVFWDEYSRRLRRNDQVHFYEVIREHHAAKLYLDLEFLRKHNPQSDGGAMTHAIVTACLEEAAILTCSEMTARSARFDKCDDIVVLDSTTDKKFSKHIIFTRVAFHDNVQMGDFVRNVVNRVVEENPQMVLVHTDDGCQVPFVDLGVYTRNRCFRLIGSSKYGKPSRLLLSGISNDRVRASFDDFSRSLVCCVSNDIFLLGSPRPTYSNLHKHNGQSLIRRNSICVSDSTAAASKQMGPVENFQKYNPLSNALNEYVLSIIEPHGGGIYGVSTMSGGNIVSYAIKGDYKFCANIGRHHKSNNVILVADMANHRMFQRCFDPDCRGFQSQPWSLPPSVLMNYNHDNIDEEALIAMMDEIDSSIGYAGGVSDALLLKADNIVS